jgi:arginyl-tRNA synthetase
MRSYTSHLDFDLELAKEASDKNPVFYVQYAYARLCNIFEKAKDAAKPEEYLSLESLGGLEKEETELVLSILTIPQFIMESAERDSPNWLTQAVHTLAGTFHTFYAKHRVVQEDRQAMLKRLYILSALKKTFEVTFEVIGITPRQKM